MSEVACRTLAKIVSEHLLLKIETLVLPSSILARKSASVGKPSLQSPYEIIVRTFTKRRKRALLRHKVQATGRPHNIMRYIISAFLCICQTSLT